MKSGLKPTRFNISSPQSTAACDKWNRSVHRTRGSICNWLAFYFRRGARSGNCTPTLNVRHKGSLQKLRKELELLSFPPVNDLPVAFCVRTRLWHGKEAPDGEFPSPLEYYFLRHGLSPSYENDLDKRIMAAAGLLSGPPLLARAKLNFGVAFRRIWNLMKSKPSAAGDSTEKGPFGPYTFEELDALIKKDPNEARWWGIRGDYLKRQGRLSEAAESYTRCLELNPNDDEAYVARGEAFCQNNSLEKGLRDFSRALQLNPKLRSGICGTRAGRLCGAGSLGPGSGGFFLGNRTQSRFLEASCASRANPTHSRPVPGRRERSGRGDPARSAQRRSVRLARNRPAKSGGSPRGRQLVAACPRRLGTRQFTSTPKTPQTTCAKLNCF